MTDHSVILETGSAGDAFAALAARPRARLCATVTPIERLPRLSKQLGGATLFVKRDDLTPVAMGGNKLRQLEFYVGEALAEGADTLLITGAVQSNFVRLAAAVACRAGMQCHLQLEERVDSCAPEYRESGNVLLDRLFGATLHRYPVGEDEQGADAELERLANGLRDAGRRPYVIHLGPDHPPLGALGYVDAAREIVAQLETGGIDIDRVVVASGSGATHAGLLFGLRLLDVPIAVTGICVRRPAAAQRQRIVGHCEGIAALLGVANPVSAADVLLDDRYLAPGYGKPGAEAREAIRLAARQEGLLVDPVYTAKALAGALQAAATPGAGVLFVHTGGSPAIFGYREIMSGVAAGA